MTRPQPAVASSVDRDPEADTDATPSERGAIRSATTAGVVGRASWMFRVAFLLRAAVLGLLGYAVVTGTLGDVITAALALLVSVLPSVAERVLRRGLVGEIHLAVATIPATEATGRIFDLYEGHPIPFDVLAHGAIGGASVLLVLVAGARFARPLVASTARTMALAVAAGLVLGAGWEVIEALLDPVLPGTLQHGVDDTLLDVSAGTVGGIVAAIVHRSTARTPAERP